MKTNLFYQNRKEIAEISEKRNVDTFVATDIFIKENDIETDIPDLAIWKAEVIKYQGHKTLTLADLFE